MNQCTLLIIFIIWIKTIQQYTKHVIFVLVTKLHNSKDKITTMKTKHKSKQFTNISSINNLEQVSMEYWTSIVT